jgi:hypothetical protein
MADQHRLPTLPGAGSPAATRTVDDSFVELPGLAALPQLIAKARQRLQDKDKGKSPHELLSPAQLKEASRHASKKIITGGPRVPAEPPRLISTNGVHFFSSMRVLNFHERTKNDMKKQRALVMNRTGNFTERDLFTFKAMWMERDLLEGDIDSMRQDIIAKGRKLDCSCRASQSRQHRHAEWCRQRLRRRLLQEDRAKEEAYAMAMATAAAEEEAKEAAAGAPANATKDRSPTKSSTKSTAEPKHILDLPRADDMPALLLRRKSPPPLPAFHTRDALVEDMHVLKWINLLLPKAVDAVNKIADDREEKDRLEREERKRKQEELQAMADAVAAAADGSDSDAGSSSEDDTRYDDQRLHLFSFQREGLSYLARRLLPEGLALDAPAADDSYESERSMYCPSEHESDFENEFEEDVGMAKRAEFHRAIDASEAEHIANLMRSAIVRMFQGHLGSIVPSTWLKYVSELGELVPKHILGRARFVDLTGSQGALSVLTALWSPQWQSFSSFEDGYENLIVGRHFVDGAKKVVLGKSDTDEWSGSESSSSSSSNNEDSDSDSDARFLKRPPKDMYEEKFQEFCRAHRRMQPQQNNATLVPEHHLPKNVVRRLDTVRILRRTWDWDTPHKEWPSSPVWEMADVLLIDQQKLWVGDGCIKELGRVINSSEWEAQTYTHEAMRALSRVYLGTSKLDGEDFVDEFDEIGEIRNRLEELHRAGDKNIVRKVVRRHDMEACDALELRASLRRRVQLAGALARCKPTALVAVVAPYLPAVPEGEDDQEEEEDEGGGVAGKGIGVDPMLEKPWEYVNAAATVVVVEEGKEKKEESEEDSEEESETEEEALYRERKEIAERRMAERMARWREEMAILKQDTVPENDMHVVEYESPKKWRVPAVSASLEETWLLGPQPEGPDDDTEHVEKALLNDPEPGTWVRPKVGPLREKWVHGSMLGTSGEFHAITSNFVFDGVRLKLWKGGIRRQCSLYQRQEHSDYANKLIPSV